MRKLSILVCTLPERKHYMDKLYSFFHNHGVSPGGYTGSLGGVEVLSDCRGREIPTGTKRNDLIQQCTGDYFCFVDDDDIVNDDYVINIMEATRSNPDVITFQGWMTTNGNHRVNWVIKLGEAYEERNGMYYRWPNHLCVFKKSLVQHIKFPDIWLGEDYQWSVKVKDSNLLQSEVHIEKQLYHYDFKTK